jgi:hypothetical protein
MTEPVRYRLRLIEDPARATRILLTIAAVTLALAGIAASASGDSNARTLSGNHPIAVEQPGQPNLIAD